MGRPRASFTSQQLLVFFFLVFFYCCLQQRNDSNVTMTVVGGDRFVPVVVDIDCAQGAKRERNVFQFFLVTWLIRVSAPRSFLAVLESGITFAVEQERDVETKRSDNDLLSQRDMRL
jgi:hypothetical protein